MVAGFPESGAVIVETRVTGPPVGMSWVMSQPSESVPAAGAAGQPSSLSGATGLAGTTRRERAL